MKQISAETFEWAKEALIMQLELLLDDPYADQNPAEVIAGLRRIAQDLGLDFDVLVDEFGTTYERDRLKKLESGE